RLKLRLEKQLLLQQLQELPYDKLPIRRQDERMDFLFLLQGFLKAALLVQNNSAAMKAEQMQTKPFGLAYVQNVPYQRIMLLRRSLPGIQDLKSQSHEIRCSGKIHTHIKDLKQLQLPGSL